MKQRPCDGEDCYCPFDAANSMDCYNHCGVGADENKEDCDESDS